MTRPAVWVKSCSLFIFLCAMTFGLSSVLAVQPTSTQSSSQTVQGEVLIISDDLFVVKSREGQGLALSLSERTKVEKGVRVGDKVEATVTSDGTALSIKRAQ